MHHVYKSINVIQAAELDIDGILSESSENCGRNESCTAVT
jgi:hypothetical protein